MNLIKRIAQKRLLYLLKQFPIVALLGPRQIGKSCLTKVCLKNYTYLDLERSLDLDRLQADPELVLAREKKVILDEAQRLPQIFPVLRSYIDRHPKQKIVLLGSASPHLIRAISEALTGRVGFLELSGVSFLEEDAEKIWLRGSFPKLHWGKPKPKPIDWYASYLRTYLEQDIPQLGYRVSSLKMRRLLTMIAHSQGSLCNLSEFGGSLGINYHSVAHLLDIFEGTFLVRRLQPLEANLKKRLVKSPKLYIRDTGILHFLLQMGFERNAILSHPKAGASFETFNIEQIISLMQLHTSGGEVYFYRTQAGAEVDLVLRLQGQWIPIEIKMTTQIPSNLKSLMIAMQDLGAKKSYIVSLVDKTIEIKKGIFLTNLTELLRMLRLQP